MSTNGFPGLPAAELESRGAAWTAREIAQQPDVWKQVGALVARERAMLDDFLGPLLARTDLRIVLTGAGTSAYVGDCLAPALSARRGRHVEAIATTELLSGPDLRLPSDGPVLLVSFARSGNSPESVAAVELAELLLPGRVFHLVITCNAEGALATRARRQSNARLLLMPDAAHDRGFAMTSSFSAMFLAGALAFALVGDEAPSRLALAAADLMPRATALAASLVGRGFERVVYLGSNELRGLASEAALKLLELTDGRVVAVSDSSLGFRHGPKTIINIRTLVVLMLSNAPYARAYDLDLLRELAREKRAGAVLALSGREDGIADVESLIMPGMREAPDLELAPLFVLFAQGFALLQSLALGLTPDRPDPAGTVNRVVQGVTIHPWNGSGGHVPRG
ncbi:MAG TPA: SIS domain-containing protein [Steroidobacteraceae bacterium]|nr:SIS domain-containing protein [Steroidobacteraceae bacterium]